MNDKLKTFFPLIIFGCVSLITVGAVLVLQPGWGFMDDIGTRKYSISFWENSNKLSFINELFRSDISYGRFRPLFYLWALVFYGLFQNHPLMFNLLVTVICLACLPVWGRSLQITYGDNDRRLLWIFCLAFFIFTPFWNIFQYLSLQERFFLIFGGLGCYFYVWAKQHGSLWGAFVSGLFFILLILMKESGLSMLAAFTAYALLDVFIFTREKKVNAVFLGMSFLFLIPYVPFLKTKVLSNDYLGAGSYTQQLSLESLLSKLTAMPAVIKLILLFGIGSVVFYFIDRFILKKKFLDDSLWLIYPLSLIAYILILLPWGYPTYLLGPISIFLFSTLYVFVHLLKLKQRNIVYIPLVLLSLFVVIFNNIPAIDVMADKRKVTEFVANHLSLEDSYLVAPPPLMEQADNLTVFTGRTVKFYNGMIEASELDKEKMNYLIMSRDCGPFKMNNLNIGPEVYRNNTWSINKIHFEENSSNVIEPHFKLDFFKKLKMKIRSI